MTISNDYLNGRTLILGDVNSGKTRETLTILSDWLTAGPTLLMTILDLAPEPVRGIGGRLSPPQGFAGRYLFADIIPPRLTGRNAAEITRLAAANARAIESLFVDVLKAPPPILVINDVTLYLQAGDYTRLSAVIQSAPTVLINAYYGESFTDHPISRRERRLTERLMQVCDQVIRMPQVT
ncbi:MAG: hypothetical protein JJV98_12655 [Desulfosarcina sp.]|nr:hypothetical protein [Desulfobacterales bacterium]